MDSFDKFIKKRLESEKLKIPENIDNSINSILNHLPEKKVYKRSPFKVLIPITLLIVLTSATVFAVNSPSVKNTINNVISFFEGPSDVKYISDKQNFERFNHAVGITVEDKGIKLTIDNIAVDDNFLNIFYTIESDRPIPKDKSEYFSAFSAFPFINYNIDGKALDILNNNDIDAYFESEYKLKGMRRQNISGSNLNEMFNLEVSTNEIFDTTGNWSISTTVDKTKASADTKTVIPKQKATIKLDGVTHKITIDKVSISPFGSQILISERVPFRKHFFHLFALFDEKGNSLDVLNTDHIQQFIGKTTNAFEFIKANRDMKYITLVPVKTESDNAPKPLPDPVADINAYPIELKVGKYGSVIIDDIVFTKNQIKITYHKEGITLFDPAFLFYDKDGKELAFDWGALERLVDRTSGRYTQILTSYENSPDFAKITKISTFANEKFELLYDQQIRIELEK